MWASLVLETCYWDMGGGGGGVELPFCDNGGEADAVAIGAV